MTSTTTKNSKVIPNVTFYTVLLIIIIGVTNPVNGDEIPEKNGDEIQEKNENDIIVQPPDVTKDKEVICEAVQSADEDVKVDISGKMDYDDLLRLTVWNSKYDLRSGEKMFEFPPEVNWKRSILARLGAIGVKTCPNDFVDPKFINAVIELFMIYQNSMNGSVDHMKEWNELTPILDLCITSSKEPLDMTSSGFELTGLNLALEDGTQQEVAILSPEELADSSQDLDIIVDTVYWLFSLSFGSCYWAAQNPSFWAARYKRMFYADFFLALKKRWLHAGTDAAFGVILGDFEYQTIIKNLRSCVTAAYTKNGLADRQLVRSLSLAKPGLGIDAGLNKKIGNSL